MMRNKCFIFRTVFLLTLVASHGPSLAATYTVTNTNDSGVGSLRQAILDANIIVGTDTIEFNIAGTGPHTIQPTSELPDITDPVYIDGYTQAGAQPNTEVIGPGLNTVLMIELDGSLAGANAGCLYIGALRGGCTVRGLVIKSFDSNGIYLTSDDNVIEGNFIMGNTVGVTILEGSNNTIGGSMAAAPNIISGNILDGIVIGGGGWATTGHQVRGNLIGTDVTGTADLGNGRHGIFIAATGNDNIIGPGNIIAFNGDGVCVGWGTGNAIPFNSIFSNDNLGIELGSCVNYGVTPNDAGDGDTGPNNLQNFPVLTSVTTAGAQVTLNSTPNTKFRIDLYANSKCDPSGYGEGETLLDTMWVTTDGLGNVSSTWTLSLPAGQFITATATAPNNNTSEFSQCVATTGIQEEAPSPIPRVLDLSQNQPNPFVFMTTICYQLPEESDVNLAIYSFTGQLVRTLVNAKRETGYYEVAWDGRDEQGNKVRSGIYFYKIQARNYTQMKKMILLR